MTTGIRKLAVGTALTTMIMLFGCKPETGTIQVPVDGTITPGATDIECDDSTSVAIELLGENIVTVTATDVMFVLDESGSVSSSEFDDMKDFVGQVIDGLNTAGVLDNGGSVGIAMFSGDQDGRGLSRVALPLSNDLTVITDGLRDLTSQSGYTCIGCGLNEATDEFIARSAPGNKRIAIVITDGNNNRPSGVFGNAAQFLTDAVDSSNTAGVERFAIGIGNGVDQDQLEEVGTDPDSTHVFTVTDFSQINLILTELVAAVVTPGSTNVNVTATIGAHFVAASPSTSHGSASVVGRDVVWTIAELGDETATLTYQLSHDPANGGGVEAVHASITFADDEGNAVAFPGASVNVHGCPATVSLSPASATNPVGGSQDLVADVDDDFGDAVADVDVTFDISAGPNTGALGIDTTDAMGLASASYTSNGVLGTDIIIASFVRGVTTVSSTASFVEWADVLPPDLSCVPAKNQPHWQGTPPPPDSESGFFQLLASDDFDPDVDIYVAGFGPFADGDIIKLTIAPGVTPKQLSIGGAAVAHLLLDRDPVVTASDTSGNTSSTTCD